MFVNSRKRSFVEKLNVILRILIDINLAIDIILGGRVGH